MSTIDQDKVMTALATVMDPDLGKDLVTLGMIRDLQIEEGKVSLRVVLTTPACPLKEKIRADVLGALAGIGVEKPTVVMDAEVRQAPRKQDSKTVNRIPNVKAVLAVVSGKGGVGKSTVAGNLAVALAQHGAKTGILDADIYGPSQPVMLGLTDSKPYATDDGQGIMPLQKHGVKVMSMGFMMAEDQAVVWRGPMLGKALQQFLDDVEWGDLDYLVVDMPPGTGDVALSLAQLIPVTGALVVTTPQDVAFADVRRAIKMLEMTQTPILGIIENMNQFVCDGCGKSHALFGASKIAAHAAERDLEILASLPLDPQTAVAADAGTPIVTQEDTAPAKAFKELAGRVAQILAIASAGGPENGEKFEDFFNMKVTS